MTDNISELVKAAKEAGMSVPHNAMYFDAKLYPHFDVFLNMHLGKPIVNPDALTKNAKVIASIPDNRITTITPDEIWEMDWTE